MVTLPVTRCSVFSEFTDEEKNEYFSLTPKKVLHHVDTLYYTVSIRGDSNEPEENGILRLLETLTENI